MKFFTLILLIACIGCKVSEPLTFEDLQGNLAQQHNNKTAGLAAAVFSPDQNVWSYSAGMANIESQDSMNLHHVMPIASVSKLVVAVAIMQLIEEELIQLDDDIRQHISVPLAHPSYPEVPITIRQLLTHRSSILDGPSYQASYTTGALGCSLYQWLTRYFDSKDEQSLASNFSTEAPGSTHSYSNVGYGLLALMIEEITMMPFPAYCQSRIFDPLGMTSTSWIQPKTTVSSATLYAYLPDQKDQETMESLTPLLASTLDEATGYTPLKAYVFPNYPDGLLHTSMHDMALFANVFIDNTNEKVLKQTTITSMFELQGTPTDKQGLAWKYTGMGTIWGHGGDDPGIQTGLYLDREEKIAMIVMKNSNRGSRTALLKSMYQAALLQKRKEN